MAFWRDVSQDVGLLLLRLLPGGLLIYGHGLSKLVHFREMLATFPNPIGVGSAASLILVMFAEVVCSTLVVLGLWTRLSVVPIVGFLMVAVFVQHLHDPWAKREFALLYATPFVALFFTGPGRFSLDAAMGSARARR